MSKSLHGIFLKRYLTAGIKKRLKLTAFDFYGSKNQHMKLYLNYSLSFWSNLLGFLKKRTFLGTKRQKLIKLHRCILWISSILRDSRHSKLSNSDCFFIFQDNFDYAQETSLDTFGCKISKSHISCFITLFFLIVLVLELGVYCYFVHF